DVDVLLGSSQETPTYAVTPLEGIRGLVNSSTRVLYAKGTEATEAANLLAIPSSVLISGDEKGARGLRGEYFNNKDLRGEPVLRRIDRQINFDWAEGSPAPAVNEDQFSARWRGKLMPPVSGEYLLGLSSDDGMSLYINGKRIIDDWDRQGTATKTASMRLEKGQTYDVLVEYREITGSAVAKLVWAPPNAQNYGDAVEVARQADVVVAVMGLNSSLENDSSDRSSLDLPKAQLGLLQSLHATGKPVVLVLINGGTLSLGWAEANVAAIVETWYPGVEGGNAIAQVLYGDYNPGGKLPVTFYRSLDQVPDFASYSMRGRTYRFATERPLYPFGYGLSYTTFRYSNLVVPASAKLGSEVALKVTVENAGNRAGSEVVQVYATRTDSQIQGAPLRELQAFKRVFLRPGEKRDLGFTLRPSQLSSFDKNGERLYEAATYRISVGNGQPNANNGTSYRPGEGGYRTLKIVR
ncbi:MAG TPA: glycoside hydrolase family 3 C-terminal domain-containing protein, partial [Fimbriimonadaceae bacterium]|nr:glycoside hydrolase family 3 C-terminal domain-containing protein [Fimbriimonadaceae bacterium]